MLAAAFIIQYNENIKYVTYTQYEFCLLWS